MGIGRRCTGDDGRGLWGASKGVGAVGEMIVGVGVAEMTTETARKGGGVGGDDEWRCGRC